MKTFLKQFEDYCKTPGIDSGKARSYAFAIEYFPEYKRCNKWLKDNGGAYMARLR